MTWTCKRPSALLGLALLAGCTASDGVDRVEPSFVEVSVQGDLGTPDDPLPFSSDLATWTFEVRTLDKNADPYPFNGDLKVRVRPGRLQIDPWITVTDGVWSGEVSFEAGFGPTRVWFADEGDKDQDSGRPASWATGVGEAINYAFPTIAEMQRIDDIESNQLEGEYAELRVADRQVVVTWVGTSGFWVTDLAEKDGPANHAHLFVYSFSKPQGIVRGSQLTLLKGANQEYLATSQFSFPTYDAAADVTLEVPDYAELTSAFACDDATMEGLESALVEATGLQIEAGFGNDPQDEDYLDYIEYGQWPAQLGDGCWIYVDSSALDFDPTDWAGQSLPAVRGLLQQVWDKWIIVANSDSEIGSAGAAEGALPREITRPLPRPPRRLPGHVVNARLALPTPPPSLCTHGSQQFPYAGSSAHDHAH